jgi:hypothetical protein
MKRSVLARSMVNNLLAEARQQKEYLQQVMPVILLVDNGQLRVLKLPDLAADATARYAQFHAIGTQFSGCTEAVFVGESWIAAAGSTVAPSEHPGRQEAVIITGRNRDNTRGVFATQVFTTENDRIIWQKPNITIKPGIAEGIVDLIFAP